MNKNTITSILTLLLFCLTINAQHKVTTTNLNEGNDHYKIAPDWMAKAVIYEIDWQNIEGNNKIQSLEKQLSELKEMGITVLCLQSIFPISSRSDSKLFPIVTYDLIPPNLGSTDDMKNLVKKAHELELYILLDWVGLYTSKQHRWLTEHPDWYMQKQLTPWSSEAVKMLNYEDPNLQNNMLKAMLDCLRDYDLDGFRCLNAELAPIEYWERARRELDALKPILLIADANKPDYHKEAFDITYPNSHYLIEEILVGDQYIAELGPHIRNEKEASFGVERTYLRFTETQVEDEWSRKVAIILNFTLPGVPFITAQEKLTDLHKRLANLKRYTAALDVGDNPAEFDWIEKPTNKEVLVFMRKNGDKHLLTTIHTGAAKSKAQTVKIDTSKYPRMFRNGLTMDKRGVNVEKLNLQGNNYRVLID